VTSWATSCGIGGFDLIGAAAVTRLPRLLVHRVGPVPPAVLLHLDALAVVHLVLGGDVVAPLARGALERDGDALLVGLGHLGPVPYLMILVTRPEPTVRPPSRM